MSDVLDNAVAGSGKNFTQCETLTSPEEDILLNADAETIVIDTQDDTFNEDEWYDELDSGNNLVSDILEISDSGKELDAEKSNDSEEGEESPTGRGKFITERVTSPAPGDSIDVKRRRLIRNEQNKNVQKVYQNSNKQIHSHFNNRNISGPRPRYNHHNNRFRFHHANGPPRFRPNVNFPQQQMFRSEFNSYNSIQPMMPQVAMMQNNGNFHNICPENMQQYPMYPQYLINQNPAAFQNPFVIPNQVPMSQQIPNAFVKSVPYIANQGGCSLPQFSAPVQGMVMQSGFPVQQQIRMPMAMSMSMQTQNEPSSNFNLTVTRTTNPNQSESRKVLINPHFKGKVDVQNARLIWDSHTKELYGHNRNNERRNMDDNELLRQQEEFINQNRRNLQKRMQGPPRNLYREPFERSYKSPPPRFRNPASGSNIKRNITRNETNSKTVHTEKSNIVVEPKEPEDEETKEYRKRVEDQQKKRDLFLKQKEERRRQRMQKDQANVDSTIKDDASLLTEANLDVTIISGFKEENVQNRLNKPVHRTGVLNLKTGLIKPKTDPKANVEENLFTSDKTICVKTEDVAAVSKLNHKSSKLHDDTKSMPITIVNSKLQCNNRQVSKLPLNNLLQKTSVNSSDITSLVDNDNIENVEDELLCSGAVEQESAQKSTEPKAGFLGRRMVIASNISKHNIVVHTESNSLKVNPESKSAGIFSNVVVNQEFSDEEDLLTFLDETL